MEIKRKSREQDYSRFLENFTRFVFVKSQPEPSDIIFIPGNGYPQMAENAAELWKEGMAEWILPSGKYSITRGRFSGVLKKQDIYTKNYETEWEFLQDVLTSNGVKQEKILKEDQAVHTYENAMHSRRVTDEAGLVIQKAIICCNAYHARRSLMYYQLLYPDTDFYVCPSDAAGITSENWYQSREGKDAVLGEMQRFGWQFHDIIQYL